MRPRARDGRVVSVAALNKAGSGPGVETACFSAPQSSVSPAVGLAVTAPRSHLHYPVCVAIHALEGSGET